MALPVAATAADAALSPDGRALDALRRDARTDPQAAVKKVATQFEALFMQMVLKSMRDATPQSGLLGTDNASQTWTGMLDQQLAGKIAQGGTGLADAIARQLQRSIGKATAAGAANAFGTAGVAADLARSRAAAVARPTAASAGTANAEAAATDLRSTDSAAGKARAFVSKVWDHALVAQNTTGIPARFIVGQAALESGWGKREITAADGTKSYNLFGIKAGAGWSGRTVDVATTEYENGVAKSVVQTFRAYNNYGEAFRDYARLLAGNPRYADVIARGGDAAAFAQAMQKSGYATDPNYGSKLLQVIAATPPAGRAV